MRLIVWRLLKQQTRTGDDMHITVTDADGATHEWDSEPVEAASLAESLKKYPAAMDDYYAGRAADDVSASALKFLHGHLHPSPKGS